MTTRQGSACWTVRPWPGYLTPTSRWRAEPTSSWRRCPIWTSHTRCRKRPGSSPGLAGRHAVCCCTSSPRRHSTQVTPTSFVSRWTAPSPWGSPHGPCGRQLDLIEYVFDSRSMATPSTRLRELTSDQLDEEPLSVPPPLSGLLPRGGLRRGCVVAVEQSGLLCMTLAAGASAAG